MVENKLLASKPPGTFVKSPLSYKLNKSILSVNCEVLRPKVENKPSNVSTPPPTFGKLRVVCMSVKGVV